MRSNYSSLWTWNHDTQLQGRIKPSMALTGAIHAPDALPLGTMVPSLNAAFNSYA